MSKWAQLPPTQLPSSSSQILYILGSNIFSYVSPQVRETKEKIEKLDYIKLKYFCTAKEIINRIKRQPMEWKIIFISTYDKGLIIKIYKEHLKLNTKIKSKQFR